jgi:hypothetical protein
MEINARFLESTRVCSCIWTRTAKYSFIFTRSSVPKTKLSHPSQARESGRASNGDRRPESREEGDDASRETLKNDFGTSMFRFNHFDLELMQIILLHSRLELRFDFENRRANEGNGVDDRRRSSTTTRKAHNRATSPSERSIVAALYIQRYILNSS